MSAAIWGRRFENSYIASRELAEKFQIEKRHWNCMLHVPLALI
jgi:hypothetical protein